MEGLDAAAAVYQAAVKSKQESREFQQLVVSHAAHNSLLWIFHGSRLALRAVSPLIRLDSSSDKGNEAARTGQAAAAKVAEVRSDDKITSFVNYKCGPREPGVLCRNRPHPAAAFNI